MDDAYRYYVTDMLRSYMGAKTRYYDIIHPVDDFDAEEVVDDIIERAGLGVKNEPTRLDGKNRG